MTDISLSGSFVNSSAFTATITVETVPSNLPVLEVVDAFIDLTQRAALEAPWPRISLVPPTVIVSRPALCWLGPPLVEYHDDRSSSVVTFPSVGTGWTVVSGGTVLAVNGIPVQHSAEEEIFDGVYGP